MRPAGIANIAWRGHAAGRAAQREAGAPAHGPMMVLQSAHPNYSLLTLFHGNPRGCHHHGNHRDCRELGE